jgi:UDP-N-acetylmuramoylalanine--D-glutamate ligase
VLLSPGAASYDLFANYVAKAAAFCELIDGLSGPVGGPH